MIQITLSKLNCPAVNVETGKKLLLSESIIEAFMPVFNDEIENKRRRLDSNWQDLKDLKSRLSDTRNQLKKMSSIQAKEKTVAQILIAIQKLVDRDVLYGNSKQAAIDTLQQLDMMDQKTLAKRLATINTIVEKHIPRVVKS